MGLQAREALGYKQLLEHLDGTMNIDQAVEQIKIRTRRFAKQQRTWLRKFRQLWGGCWIDAESNDSQSIANKALAYIDSQWKSGLNMP
jgi:tRNA dimethylallyltransferase